MWWRTSSWRALLVAVVLLLPFAMPASASPAWRIVDLGAGDGSIAYAINARGHVAGHGENGAFLWRNNGFTGIGPIGVIPLGMNNRDDVVGYRVTPDGYEPFLWRNGVYTALALPAGATGAFAKSINDRGEIAGWTDGDGIHAVVWRAGRPTDVAPGRQAIAEDIDSAGRIVGTSYELDPMMGTGALWWRGRTTLLASDTWHAKAISDAGTIVGTRAGVGGLSAGFVLRHGVYTTIPQLPGDPGTTFVDPVDVNNRDQVAGTTDAGAFFWERGRTTILPSASRVATVGAINDRGVVAGSVATTPQGEVFHAVIWMR